jgi:hypothetical protein
MMAAVGTIAVMFERRHCVTQVGRMAAARPERAAFG